MNPVRLRYESGVPVAVRLAIFLLAVLNICVLCLSINQQKEAFFLLFWAVQAVVWLLALFLTSLLPLFGKCSLQVKGDTLIIRKSVFGICWSRKNLPLSQLSITCNTRTEIRGAYRSNRRTIQVYIPVLRTPEGLIQLPAIHRQDDADRIMMQLHWLLGQ